MTDQPAVPQEPGRASQVSVHVLRPATPTRAFAAAAVGSVLGAVLIVLSATQQWAVVVTILGVLILVAGLALLGLGILTVLRMQVKAELTPKGYTFRTPTGVRHGTWAETVRVTSSESGRRISFHRSDESTQNVITPVGADDPAMVRLVDDLTERLRSSRS
ncbi:MAG: hypothetical protein Q4F67_00840 [Propionibacteriaceae bacterium]|nr:hypothetical protein [Propionibacteriaceae bacterium]